VKAQRDLSTMLGSSPRRALRQRRSSPLQSGFLTFTQWPDEYTPPSRFETIPSTPTSHSYANTYEPIRHGGMMGLQSSL
jgi:hypothetical protein